MNIQKKDGRTTDKKTERPKDRKGKDGKTVGWKGRVRQKDG